MKLLIAVVFALSFAVSVSAQTVDEVLSEINTYEENGEYQEAVNTGYNYLDNNISSLSPSDALSIYDKIRWDAISVYADNRQEWADRLEPLKLKVGEMYNGTESGTEAQSTWETLLERVSVSYDLVNEE